MENSESPPEVDTAIQSFHRDGFVTLKGVFDPVDVETFGEKAMACFHEVLDLHIFGKGRTIGIGIKHGYKEIVQRHERRYEMPYKMSEIGALNFSTNPQIQELVTGILGSSHHVVNVSLVVSAPGARDQGWHADGPHVSVSKHLPCHVLNLFIPLVDVYLSNGPTSFRPGSHYLTIDLQKRFLLAAIKKELRPIETPCLKKGSVLLFDYRVLHRGTANMSDSYRPMLVLTFGKSWYQDTLNFPKNSVYDPIIGSDNFISLWTHEEASEVEVKQLATSGCGATAVMTVIKALDPQREIQAEEVLKISVLRNRANDAPLPQYLASRSVAGCSGEEILGSVRAFYSNAAPSSTTLVSQFYPCCTGLNTAYLSSLKLEYPQLERDFAIDGTSNLIEWLANKIKDGQCIVATLNLQLLGNDAWHHQVVYAVDLTERLIWCLNPMCCYSENMFKSFLCTPSILVIKAGDVKSRHHLVGGDESIYAQEKWLELKVASQIQRCIDARDHSQDILIPAVYKGGISTYSLSTSVNT